MTFKPELQEQSDKLYEFMKWNPEVSMEGLKRAGLFSQNIISQKYMFFLRRLRGRNDKR